MTNAQWTPPRPAPSYTAPDKKRGKRGIAQFLMYGFLALLLGTAALGMYSHFAPRLQKVPNTVAEGVQQDRVNILLIGIGGDTHPGSGKALADAVMVLSLKPSTGQAAMISIPRDYYVSMGRQGKHRINAAHEIGESDGPGGGPKLLMEAAQTVLGQPMHAYVRIDFAAFRKIIDELGGIDVYVHRSFYDFLFKDGFKQGWQHMNGDRALRFARYRYVMSEEGNNYARELRQQQVLAAIRDKVRSLPPQQALRLAAVARAVSSHTSTNLTTEQLVNLYSRYRNMSRDQVRHVSLAPFTRSIPTGDPNDPTPAVGPRSGDDRQIQAMARTVFREMTPIVTKSQIQLRDQVR